jgi:hypothetical protein
MGHSSFDALPDKVPFDSPIAAMDKEGVAIRLDLVQTSEKRVMSSHENLKTFA